jgi:hypothetical protein
MCSNFLHTVQDTYKIHLCETYLKLSTACLDSPMHDFCN